MLQVLVDVTLLVFFCHVILRPPTGFLFDFEPGIHIIFEEPLTGFFKMPGFIDVLNLVPQFDGFIQLWGAPGTGEGALFVGVRAMIGSVQKRFVHFFFHTTGTEGKEQFVTMTVR